ncbi:MAG: endolytic transglycosylase MltG [Acetobacteraceae bacterium]
MLDHGLTPGGAGPGRPLQHLSHPRPAAGPICMPGLAALHAVTQPAQTDALYFVADGTGGHVFASTEAEHLRNVAHWRAIEREHAQAPAPVQQ